MRRDDSDFLIHTKENNASKLFKMTKARTAMLLVMIICSCGLIFSITDAYPTPEAETSSEETKLGNNSRLVITNVVKTIEFEVGVIDDDGRDDENSTDSNAADEFYETDIQLLNVDLLREVMNEVTGEENSVETMQPKQPPSVAITNEENNEQVRNGSLQLNQTSS